MVDFNLSFGVDAPISPSFLHCVFRRERRRSCEWPSSASWEWANGNLFYVQVRLLIVTWSRSKIPSQDKRQLATTSRPILGRGNCTHANQKSSSTIRRSTAFTIARRLPAAVSPSPFILIMFSSIVASDWPACLIDLTSGFFFSLSKLHINWEELRERRQLIFLFFFSPIFCAFVRRRIPVTWYTFVHKCERVTGLLLLDHDYQSVFPSFSLKSLSISHGRTRENSVGCGQMFDGFVYQ